MLVKKITFTNHEVLGNMEMSFVKSGKTSKTIIFIGECGTGKTTILNSISEITQAAPEGYLGNHPHLEAEITIELENELDDNINYQNAFREKYIQNNSGKEIVHNGIWLKFCNSTPLGNIMNPKKLHNKIISVQPEAIFIPVDNFKKLISMDNAIAAASYREGKVLFDELAHSPNMINFINAYKFYFPDIRIELEKNELIIKKNNKVLEYRELSMGERKIIDRGAQILSSGIANPIITLDEPENSLSPLWREKILTFYKKLTTHESTHIQKGQIFVATQSENIVKESLESPDTQIFFLKNTDGKIKYEEYEYSRILPWKSLAEIQYTAFNFPTNDFHDELYGWIEENTKNPLFNPNNLKIDEFIIKYGELDEKHKKIEWSDLKKNETYDVCLCKYIRNFMHHRENKTNKESPEIAQSIKYLINVIKNAKIK